MTRRIRSALDFGPSRAIVHPTEHVLSGSQKSGRSIGVIYRRKKNERKYDVRRKNWNAT